MADPEIHVPMAYGTPVPMEYSPTAPTAPLIPTANTNDQPLSPSTIASLREQGFTTGLTQALQTNKLAFAKSIWIVDNSGSMQTRDGKRIVVDHHHNYKLVECSRWAELQQTVEYHAQLAALVTAPTTFRLLNDPGRVAGPQTFSIAVDGNALPTAASLDRDVTVALQTMNRVQPGGVTPLVPHLAEIRQEIVAMEPSLRASGTKVAIILATDGLPTDTLGYHNDEVRRQFDQALRQLEGLPVWLVVRMCTDEDEIVEYYNNLDAQLEMSLEVLDDFTSEAKEVCEHHNSWLTYGLPLHRMREMGFYHRVIDMLDERRLSKEELRDFFRLLFGPAFDEAPDPEVDWHAFVQLVNDLQSKEPKVWNPITKRMTSWVDIKKLNREYGHGGWFGLW